MIEGLFIVIEGVDGIGKTTLARRVAATLRQRELPVLLTQEPSKGPVGALIRQILSGRLVVPGIHGSHEPSWATMGALFAADRLDHLDATIIPNLSEGVNVVCDRYDYSSVAFQALSAGGDDDGAAAVGWLKELNRYARRPDLTLVLDAPADVARRRRDERVEQVALYEEDAFQERLTEFYKSIDSHFPEDRIVHVDAQGDEVAVAQRLVQVVDDFRHHRLA